MRTFIETYEHLKQVVDEEIRPYCSDKNNLLALDTETYNTSYAGTVIESESESEDEELDEVDIDLADSINILPPDTVLTKTKAAVKAKKKPNIVPRPLPLKDGSLTGVARLLQLGLDPNNVQSLGGKQFIIDLDKIGYRAVGSLLKPLLEKQLILGQNLKYDFLFMYACLDIYLTRMLDTMLIAQVLGAGVDKGYSLADLYDRCIDYKWFLDNIGMDFHQYKAFKAKNQKTECWSGVLSESQLEYAAHDVYLIFYVWESLRERAREFRETYEIDLPETQGTRAVIKLECGSIPMYSLMEYRGIKLDIPYHRDVLIPKLARSREQADAKIDLTKTYQKKCGSGRGRTRKVWEETITEKILLTSHQQLKAAMYKVLEPYCVSGRITVKLNKAGIEKPHKYFLTFPGCDELELTTQEALFRRLLNEDEIRDCLDEVTCKLIRDILQFKQAASLMSKFGQKLIDCCTNRGYIHPNWKPIGAESGRMACAGPNVQQIPSRGELRDGDATSLVALFRNSICAEEGWVLIGADYSQIEARYAAKWCNQQYLVNKYNNRIKVDIHGENGKALLGLSYIPEKGDPNRDVIGKTGGFSVLYGAYPKKLVRFMFDQTDGKVNWTLDEGKAARNKFFHNYPEFEQKQIEYRSFVESLPRQNNNNLHSFRFFPATGKTVPFLVATGDLGLRRPRQFAIPRDYSYLSPLQLDKFYKMTPDDQTRYKLRFGNFYSSVLDQASREGFNHSIQSSCADLLKLAAWLVHNEMIALGIPLDEGIIALVHDEILLHVRAEHATIVKNLVEECMVRANDILGSGIVVEAGAQIGRTWYEVH